VSAITTLKWAEKDSLMLGIVALVDSKAYTPRRYMADDAGATILPLSGSTTGEFVTKIRP
jgi:hypothetical protein